VGADNEVFHQWVLYPNGTISKQYHLEVTYKAALDLAGFPFDKHYLIATRRTRSQLVDRVKLNIAAAQFTVPPANVQFKIGSPQSKICPRHEISKFPTSDCRALCTNATCPGWQPGMPPIYVPARGNCPPNPSCNATFPFPNCHLTCGETAALCQDVFVFYFPIFRKPNYFIQNMVRLCCANRELCRRLTVGAPQLAPIILVTIMAAAAYWNELDDYVDRIALMATALLSMMALQAYVAGQLPETETITFIHYALYTSYALMGFGVAFLICVSFVLKHDILAAKRNAENCKIWMLRKFYGQCLVVKRIVREGMPIRGDAQREMHLSYFPQVAALLEEMGAKTATVRREGLLGQDDADEAGDSHAAPADDATTWTAVEVAQPASPDEPRLYKWATGNPCLKRVRRPRASEGIVARLTSVPKAVARTILGEGMGVDLDGDGKMETLSPAEVLLVQTEDGRVVALFCPPYVWLRWLVIEFDNFMKYGHLLVFFLTIAVRYWQIQAKPFEEPTCMNLLSFVTLEALGKNGV